MAVRLIEAGVSVTILRSLFKRRVSAWRSRIQFKNLAVKAVGVNHTKPSSIRRSSVFLQRTNTVVVVLSMSSMMLVNGQACGVDNPSVTTSGPNSVNSIEGFHDTGRLSFSINFANQHPIQNGYEFQLFFDADFSSSSGYGQGYEALLRGVQLVPQSPLDFVNTIGGSSSGGWGSVLSTASFNQINDFDFQISLPRTQPLPLAGSVQFGYEIYHWGELVDSAIGLFTSQAPFEDCNGNGLDDSFEIADGSTPDCNTNGIPDSCDIAINQAFDCNGNGVPDSCDIASLDSDDCNGNLIPDECEPDCNNNNQVDSCDLAMGLSSDCDLNDIPDECQPIAMGKGSRHLEIHPPAGSEPLAIRIYSMDSNSKAYCLPEYVQADGSLANTRAFFLPSQWCTVFVTHAKIIPNSSYRVELLSIDGLESSAVASTWMWGDADGTGNLNLIDILMVIVARSNGYSDASISSDVMPCEPNGQLELFDILATINAVANATQFDQICPVNCGN